MNPVQDLVLRNCDASSVIQQKTIQRLWSDFGEIIRLELAGGSWPSVIVKRVDASAQTQHPRGWSSTTSTARKLRSYEVEACWYEQHASGLPESCRVPRALAVERGANGLMILMEDLDIEFPKRGSELSVKQSLVCLSWLAYFHAHHLGSPGDGLWPVGTYWHLETRQDEYEAMAEGAVKEAAQWLDIRLRTAQFQTLVHGDAKVANFCFSDDFLTTAAVDFQYVGRGPGIRDVAYFLGSCLSEATLAESADELLDYYFKQLRIALSDSDRPSGSIDEACVHALEDEWRALYPIAWVDFYRFLLGWAPDHQKINAYTRHQASLVLG